MSKTVRIGCARRAGATPALPLQLVHGGKLDYLVFDYLEYDVDPGQRPDEDPQAGYATDFVEDPRAVAGRYPAPGHPRDQQCRPGSARTPAP